MKNKVIIISSIVLLLLASACTKENSKILCIRVVSGNYDGVITGVEEMEVRVTKYREGYFPFSTVISDRYYGKTDSLGYCNILIDDYDDQYYYYSVRVNNDLRGNKYSGSDIYSVNGKQVYYSEFDSTITIRLTRIPSNFVY